MKWEENTPNSTQKLISFRELRLQRKRKCSLPKDFEQEKMMSKMKAIL